MIFILQNRMYTYRFAHRCLCYHLHQQWFFIRTFRIFWEKNDLFIDEENVPSNKGSSRKRSFFLMMKHGKTNAHIYIKEKFRLHNNKIKVIKIAKVNTHISHTCFMYVEFIHTNNVAFYYFT